MSWFFFMIYLLTSIPERIETINFWYLIFSPDKHFIHIIWAHFADKLSVNLWDGFINGIQLSLMEWHRNNRADWWKFQQCYPLGTLPLLISHLIPGLRMDANISVVIIKKTVTETESGPALYLRWSKFFLNEKGSLVCVSSTHSHWLRSCTAMGLLPDMSNWIAGCACAGKAGNVCPAIDLKGNR